MKREIVLGRKLFKLPMNSETPAQSTLLSVYCNKYVETKRSATYAREVE